MPWVKENGAVGVVTKPFEGHRFMLDPYFFPYFEAAQENDLAMTIHIANANEAYVSAIASAYDPSGGLPTFRMPTVHACNGLILSDIPEALPRAALGLHRVVVPVGAVDHPRVVPSREAGRLVLPGQPVQGVQHLRLGPRPDDDFPYVFDYVGDENIVIGTDYGHTDTSSEVDAIETFRKLDTISEESKRKVLVDNSVALYGL